MIAPPHVILRSAAQAEAETDRLRGAGFRVQEGFDLPAYPWDVGARRIVCRGELRSNADVAAAALAAARGAGIVAFGGTADAVAQLSDDLSRVGEVRIGPSSSQLELLGTEQRRLLALLADGHTVRAAADACGLASRTAARRLAAGRAALGVESNAELVVAFVRLRLAHSED